MADDGRRTETWLMAELEKAGLWRSFRRLEYCRKLDIGKSAGSLILADLHKVNDGRSAERQWVMAMYLRRGSKIFLLMLKINLCATGGHKVTRYDIALPEYTLSVTRRSSIARCQNAWIQPTALCHLHLKYSTAYPRRVR